MTLKQNDPYSSPWTIAQRVRMLLWECAWLLLCVWTPKPFNHWRLLVLRLFGASLHGKPFVHQRARIAQPWNLTMLNHACLGDRANAYSLGEIEIREGATVAQEAYLCTGTHDFADRALPMKIAKITIGAHAFVGARAFILPGVNIGERALVGACSVVTKDVPSGSTVSGSPAREHALKQRE